MAKRRRSRSRSSSAPIVRTVRAPAPVIRVSAPRQVVRRRSRRGGGGGTHSLTAQRMFALGLGGAALGYLEKSFPSIPTLPVIGRKGTIALACYYFSKGKGGHGGLLRDVAIAAASIAGYELGNTGKISGDVADQVHGIAAQV